MYLLRLLEDDDGASREGQTHTTSATFRMSTRCRRARTIDMDAIAYDDSELPRTTFFHTASRDETVHQSVRDNVPVLGVCG